MATVNAKANGAYYTPLEVARTLVRWAIRRPEDRMLDPSCGDGQFLTVHANSTGIEHDLHAAATASRRAPGSLVHVEDFFRWAEGTEQRFDFAAGNPPFIRYQRFAGETRRRALDLCRRHGADFSALSSSWALFLVAAASLLKRGGRMAFVTPAEIGHAPYAVPLLSYLTRSFAKVQLVAMRETVFPHLSQDVWLLYAEGFGRSTEELILSPWDEFRSTARPPARGMRVPLADWRRWNSRLRPFLASDEARGLYQDLIDSDQAYRLGHAARVGIGYVTGANDFFHLRPSQGRAARIPSDFLLPAVRTGRMLPTDSLTESTISDWDEQDLPYLLLRIKPTDSLPDSVAKYLDSAEGRQARASYKCRNRHPWYCVPDVVIPDGFLAYMSGEGPALVSNAAGSACTNSLHAVRMRPGHSFRHIQAAWDHPLTRLSVEIEGHPLGGGMLKVEPGEAARIVVPRAAIRLSAVQLRLLDEARATLRKWRHYG